MVVFTISDEVQQVIVINTKDHDAIDFCVVHKVLRTKVARC